MLDIELNESEINDSFCKFRGMEIDTACNDYMAGKPIDEVLQKMAAGMEKIETLRKAMLVKFTSTYPKP